MKFHWFTSLVVVFFLCGVKLSAATLTSSDVDERKATEEKGPRKSVQAVNLTNLITETPKWKDIVRHHGTYDEETNRKLFNGTVLGYITPWNSHGYDVVKLFSSKFNYASPVWLQVRRNISSVSTYTVTGQHDIDKDWVSTLKTKGVKVVPRLLFDGWTGGDYTDLLSSPKDIEKLTNVLIKFTQLNNFDGLVLEIWSQLGGHPRWKRQLSEMIVSVCEKFHEESLVVILVVPPPIYYGDHPGMFVKNDFDLLSEFVDAFSLMTYDYSNPQRPGPNAPLSWVRACVESLVPAQEAEMRSKILLGLNLYGNEYTSTGGGPIIGSRYIETLHKHKPKFKWDDAAKEHLFEFKLQNSKRLVYYPSLISVRLRLSLAEELGTGISLWELGQGLDYFYDLF